MRPTAHLFVHALLLGNQTRSAGLSRDADLRRSTRRGSARIYRIEAVS